MGSSTHRKPADHLIINRPIKSETIGAGGGGNNTAPQDINNTCPLTIQVKIADQKITLGSEIVINNNALILASDRTTKIGIVSKPVLKRLETCLGLGISYPRIQVVSDKKGNLYAEFSQ
jgi:hypothetical protein